MADKKKACRVVWFDENDKHISAEQVKAIITPRYFANARALACKRGEFSFKSGRLGTLKAKSMTAKEQAKIAPPKKRRRKRKK